MCFRASDVIAGIKNVSLHGEFEMNLTVDRPYVYFIFLMKAGQGVRRDKNWPLMVERFGELGGCVLQELLIICECILSNDNRYFLKLYFCGTFSESSLFPSLSQNFDRTCTLQRNLI